MTDPTHDQVQDRPPWRLVLDEGERLEVRSVQPDAGNSPVVTLVLPAWRAADLGHVLDAYTRLSAIIDGVRQVSAVESSLARALADASAVARGTEVAGTRSKIVTGDRLKAMAVLQDARPELSHSKLVAIIDAAAWWLDNGMDLMAMDLLSTVDENVGAALYFTLLGRGELGDPPPAPTR